MTEVITWRSRELNRQMTRKMPVWQNEAWWQDNREIHAGHFVYVSESNPPLLAYTVDEEKGKRDIQTPIKPGRYLAKYFSGILTEKQIAYYAAWQTRGARPVDESESKLELKFAETEKEIVDVYKRGPTSCMDARHFRHFESNPVRVYAAGDLAIAYLEGKAPPNRPEYDVIARCLVWPDKKAAGRIYPTPEAWREDGYESREDSERVYALLESKLREAGYKFEKDGVLFNGASYVGASFNGAELQKISAGGGSYLMPYLDHAYGVDDAGDSFVMSDSPEIKCDNTSGEISIEPEYRCDRCGEGVDADDTSAVRTSTGRYANYESWCPRCEYNNTFYCHGFEEIFSDNVVSVVVDGDTYTLRYAENDFTYSNFSDEWFDPATDPAIEVDSETWRESEFLEHGFICAIDGENYPATDMHPQHKGIHKDSNPDDIAEWLESEAKESARHAVQGQIEADEQKELAL